VTARPIQLNDAAFLMLRKAIANVDAETGFPLGAADVVPAAELVDAEYATVRDIGDRIELRATPAGVRHDDDRCRVGGSLRQLQVASNELSKVTGGLRIRGRTMPANLAARSSVSHTACATAAT
jgi:hypothetical protein